MAHVEDLWAGPNEGQDSRYYLERQESRESNARTYARNLHIAVARAEGIFVTDVDGRQYYDCLSAAGTLALGHNHPFIHAAIRRALDEGVPLQTLDLATPLKDAFVDALFSTLPESFASNARIQFCSPAGTDAIEAAIKLVKTATGKPTMLSFQGGYHGQTQGALALMGSLSPKSNVAGVASGVQFFPYPYSFRCPFGRGGAETARLSAALVRSALTDPEGGVLPAGMVLETIQGEGGVIPAPVEWLKEIRAVTETTGVPMIVDEVQSGWGRTGRMYGFEHGGIEPDVLVVSKAIGGGLPLAAIVYRQELDRWQPGAHAGTFRGNQLAMACGLATLQVIREENLTANAANMGERLASHLREIQKDFPLIGDVRGRGLMIGAEIVDREGQPDALGAPAQGGDIARAVRAECLRRGLILELGGRHGAVVRFLPPLTVTAEQIDSICAIFREACRQVAHSFRRPIAV
ncbi:MAG TPA: diaminobutyrate--2-oxoglutarate transaminase [Magnetospirillaceae bacterium]|nr:diaminobutyrate--2-oxoglutarate transaminase [Magnetospirillaceae bacterium]